MAKGRADSHRPRFGGWGTGAGAAPEEADIAEGCETGESGGAASEVCPKLPIDPMALVRRPCSVAPGSWNRDGARRRGYCIRMISIKKHLGGEPSPAAGNGSYLGTIECILRVTEERMPSGDEEERARFASQLSAWLERLADPKQSGKDGKSDDDVAEILHSRWDAMERDFSKREQEFTGIIGLLAETAAKLDQSNRGYYEKLHQSVRSLKTVGNTEDISALRRTLSERVGQLETTVSQQQTESVKVMAELRTGIRRVRTEAQVISKFVSTQALNRTPGRRHAERYLEDLARQEVPFVLAVIRLEKLDSLSRRHDDKAAEQVVQHFLSLLRDSLRRQVYLYRWSRDTIVALGDTISLSELGEPLRELTGQVARDGLRLDEISARPIGLHPRYTVQEVPGGAPLDETIKGIEQFSGDKA